MQLFRSFTFLYKFQSKIIILQLAVVLLCSFLNVQAQEKNVVAIVYKPLEGHDLLIKRSGTFKWIELTSPFHLYHGDSLRNGPNRQLVYMVDNSAQQNRFLLEPAEIRTFVANTSAINESQNPGRFIRLLEDFWDSILRKHETEMAGASRGSGGLDETHLLYPYMVILQTQPPFHWRQIRSSNRYIIALQEMQSGKIIFTTTTPDTTILIPEDKPELKFGEIYRVSLTAEGKSPKIFSFQIADYGTIQAYKSKLTKIKDEIKRNPQSEQQRIESEILYLIGNGFLSEAWLSANRALSKFPENEIFRNAVIYYENALGINKEVIKDE